MKRSAKATKTLPKPPSENNQNLNNQNTYQTGGLNESGKAETAAATDRALMTRMRVQIETLTTSLTAAEERNKTLEQSVRIREVELGKELQRVTNRAVDGGMTDGESKMDMLLMADGANARIIDQLNGQVDFLNDQLAMRESQIAELSEKLLGAQEIRQECEDRGALLDASREENAVLVAELRELEERVCLCSWVV